MSPMLFKNLSELTTAQKKEYGLAVQAAFPPIIQQSAIIKKYWAEIERSFPDHQLFAYNDKEELLGIINSIPFNWNDSLDNLPDRGWDFIVEKGIEDKHKKRKPNTIGGLQIIVPHAHRGKGYSKFLIAELKELKIRKEYENLVIPIRPTLKHNHPQMKMQEFLLEKKDGWHVDPWIRTHIKCGGEVIKVCEQSMFIEADLGFWSSISTVPLINGFNIIQGALNPVYIDMEKKRGEYIEENIWIKYT